MDAVRQPPTGHGIDLHCHSTASDGRLTPEELVAAAAKEGVRLLALTDHDTMDGLPAAQASAQTCGITLVPGVEISARLNQRTLHIVGLNVNPQTPTLCAGLAELQQQRRQRAQTIAAKLERLGVGDALQRATLLARGGQITRTHFARLLVDAGVCKSLQQTFKRYLGAGKAAYAAAQWVPMAQAIEWIEAAGGIAVLAHPMQYRLSATAHRRMLEGFREAGGRALEVCSGNSQPADVQRCADDARHYGLLGSVGSDFHGPEQYWLRLGGAPPLPDDITPVWSRFSTPRRI